jgi:hypothetical protein
LLKLKNKQPFLPLVASTWKNIHISKTIALPLKSDRAFQSLSHSLGVITRVFFYLLLSQENCDDIKRMERETLTEAALTIATTSIIMNVQTTRQKCRAPQH